MARFRCKSCPVGETSPGEGAKPPDGRRSPRQADVGPKTRSAGRGPPHSVPRAEGARLGVRSQGTERGTGPRERPRGSAQGKQMEFVLIGRGERVARRLRQLTEHKLARLERIEPRLTRLEIVVTAEKNPRRGGIHRVEAVASAPRKSYLAHAEAKDVESALDVVAERLERQIRDHHERRLARRNAGAGRVKSAKAPGETAELDVENPQVRSAE